MASTSTKLSSGTKTSPRSLSQTRLVATKTSTKQKIASAPKARTSPSTPPPTSIVKNSRWQKSRPASISPVALPAPGAPTDERPTRSGVSKNELKAQFAKLSAATSQIGGLKRALNKTFFEIGALLNQIRNERLYEVKGYGSFESFVEREIDINKVICLKIARIAEALHRDQALAAGLERAAAAIAALDGETESSALVRPAGSPAGGVPVHKQ